MCTGNRSIWGAADCQTRGRDAVLIPSAHFGYPRAEKRPDQKLDPLELRLEDDQGEVDVGVHGAGHVLNGFDLL